MHGDDNLFISVRRSMHINVLILTCVCAFVRLDMPQRVHACEIVLVRAPRVCIHVQEYQGQCYLLCARSGTCVCLCVVSVCRCIRIRTSMRVGVDVGLPR